MNVVTFPWKKARSHGRREEAGRDVFIYLEYRRLFYLPTQNNQKSYRGRWTCVSVYGFALREGGITERREEGDPSSQRMTAGQSSREDKLAPAGRSLNESSHLSHCWGACEPSKRPLTPPGGR